MREKSMKRIILRLKGWYQAREWWRTVNYNPFEVMVAIAVSQRTYYKNIIRFMKAFSERYRSPEDVVKAGMDELIASCRVIGMANRRARMLYELCRRILDIGGVNAFLELPPEEARELLLSVEGIGEKTADMILVALFDRKYLIVDANILRVMKRLKIIPADVNIYKARQILEPWVPLNQRVFLHTALVSLGQRICKPRNPNCSVCPLNTLCEYSKGA